LTVEFASLPEKLDAGTTYEIDVLVKNIGEAVAEGFNVELVADGVSVGKTRIESLAAGASRTVVQWWPAIAAVVILIVVIVVIVALRKKR